MNEKKTQNEILDDKNLDNLKNKFFSFSQELFLIADLNGPIKWINPAWETLLGYSSTELINSSIFNIIHPNDLELSKGQLIKISKGFVSPGTEVRIKNKNGKFKWYLWNAKVYEEENLFFALGKDITVLKETEDELRLLKTLVFAFNKLANLEQSLNITLKEICQFTEWPYGEAWIQENNTLIRLTSWHIETEEIKQFFEDTTDYKSKPGQGLIGTAWLSQKPIWVENLKEEKKFLRASYLKNTGLNSYFLVPILSNQEVIAALAFFQYGNNSPNNKLINLLTTIADHMGALIDHKNIEERLIKNEKLISETEKIANTGNWEIDFKKDKFYWSDGLFSIYGIEPTKNINREDITNKIYPDDRSKVLSNLDNVLKEKAPFVIEYRIIRSDGSIRNLISKGGILQLEDGTVTKLVGITQDVTTQKEAEIKLKNSHEQLKRLSAHLQSAREEERTRIAREIHDELGQSLTGLKMDLAWIEKKYNSNEPERNLITDKIKSMSQLIDSTIKTVRKISSELRPGVLDYLGLPAAIEWQAQDFQNRTGIKCKINSLPADLNIEHDLSTAIFRIFQETLTNVARHSNADKVDISLYNYNDHLILEVKDNGTGITEAEIQNLKSFGLLGMRERTEMFGGEFKIFGSKKGTIVTVQIPLSNIMGDI